MLSKNIEVYREVSKCYRKISKISKNIEKSSKNTDIYRKISKNYQKMSKNIENYPHPVWEGTSMVWLPPLPSKLVGTFVNSWILAIL